MGTYTGTSADEIITPDFVSPTVIPAGAAPRPSAAADLINAGGGNDTVEGGGGADEINLGSGNDVFTWRRGDGNDIVDGGSDFDILRFLATTVSETLSLASNGNRALLFSSPNSGPNAQIDLNAIERIELAVDAFDGVAIFDLRGTGIADVAIQIAPGETFLSSFSFQAVTAAVNLVFAGDLDLIVVTGLGARVTIAGLDGVTLNSSGTSSFYAAGSAGNDSFDTSGLDQSVDLDDGISLAGRGGIDTFILGEARESIDASGGTTGSSRVDYRYSNAPVAVILQWTFW